MSQQRSATSRNDGRRSTTEQEIRREDDDELLGFIAPEGSKWLALTVFGGRLGAHDSIDDAERHVEQLGLSSLAEKWWIDLGDGWEVCSLVEASPSRVVVVRSNHTFDGTPVLVPTGTELRLTPPC